MRVVRRSSPFLRQFGGPDADSGIVCFKFWQAVVASGCPGACAYCFLQTQEPYRTGLYDLNGTLFENLHPRLERETLAWLRDSSAPRGLIVGENQDGLAFERPYKTLLGKTPLEVLVPLFLSAESNATGCRLVVLSKFTTTEFAEAAADAAELKPNDRVIFSWSLSLPSISREYERKVAPLPRRLAAAVRLKRRGWAIRFRLDALSPVPGWEEGVRQIVAQINDVAPEMLTLGSLRASDARRLKSAAIKNGRDGAIFDALREKDPSGFKYRLDPDVQAEMFRAVRDQLDPSIRLDLCKEDVSVWRRIGLSFDGCHCLAGARDPIVGDRVSEGLGLVALRRAQQRSARSAALKPNPPDDAKREPALSPS